MKKIRHYITWHKKIGAAILMALLALSPIMASAQTEKYVQVLTGIIKKDDSCVVADDKFNEKDKWSSIEKTISVDNLISFELRYDTSAHYLNRNFSCSLLADIEYQTADRTKHRLRNISLDINYDTAAGSSHQGIAYYKFKDAHNVKLVVNKITSAAWGKNLPPVFRIKNEIFIDRQYKLDTKSTAVTVAAYNVISSKPGEKTSSASVMNNERNDIAGQQVTISWDGNSPAFPEYDFEWTFYDDFSLVGNSINTNQFGFSPGELENVFRNNCSRVTVNLPAYQLNVMYNKGWVFHRVRGIRYDEVTGERTEGAWSYAGSYQYNNAGYGLFRSDGHEESLNWQYKRAFAEEGKRKEWVSYFDGSLRSRQTVTLNNDNSGSRAVVQEDIFDAQGRAAVHVLPVPTADNAIHYFHSFNTSAATGLPFSFTDIASAGSCIKIPSAMNTGSGAAQYYSPANPLKDDNSSQFFFTKYLPDAKGYPFAVNSFTPDNTGRVRTQGGVGPIYQPGQANMKNDHTTRYFYGKPQQEELDRLFGNEAGNASHYQKTMLTDPNGQTSITYLNAAGKTIATALSGKAPENVKPLASYKIKNTPYLTSLSNRDDFVRDEANLALTYSSTFLAQASGQFNLQYSFTPLSLQVLYGVDNEKICADCYYDLEVNITDNCGNAIQHLAKEAVFTEKTTCEPTPTEQEGQVPVTIDQPGEYHISWQLKLSRRAIDFYLDKYLLQNLAIKKEIDFQKTYLHNINLSQCFNNCETCMAELGTTDDFIKRITGVLQQQDIVPNDDDIIWIKTLYRKLLDDCSLLQPGCGKTASPCEEQVLQLREDVSLGGQYLKYDPATSKFIDRDLNVFLKNRTTLTTSISINGVSKPFNQFTEEEIISNWNNEWALILLPYHPENSNNCFILDCGKNAANDLYDNSFLNTVTTASAKSQQFWLGDDFKSVVNNDPYFRPGAEGATKKAAFINAISNYNGTGVDIMSFVRWSVYCKDKTNGGALPAAVTPCPRSVACNQEQDEWTLFKVLYYAAKQEIKDKNNACNSSALFPDPTELINQVVNPSAVVTPACADATLFQISSADGNVIISYEGVQPIVNDVTVRYFAVNENNELVTNAAGAMVFPTGTTTGTTKTANAVAGLVYVIDYARCDVSHPYYTKARRNYNGLNLAALSNNIQDKSTAALNASGVAAVEQQCSESCEQNADGWMQKLEGCGMAINSAEYNQIRIGLIAVCKSSCSVDVQNHPFGASSTTIATAYNDKDFRDVLLRVLGANRFSAICNDLLLDYPLPVTVKQLYVNELVRTLSACAYEKIQSWKKDWISVGGHSGFTDYVRSNIDPQFSLTDAEINSLVNAYENNCFTPLPVVLPASLSCSGNINTPTCLSCTALSAVQAGFMNAYKYVQVDDPAYYDLLAKYINQTSAFNLSSVDVFSALQQCVGSTGESHTDSLQCSDFKKAFDHFTILQPNYFTNPNKGLRADSLYEIYLTLWLNTELHQQLDFNFYKQFSDACGIQLNYPGQTLPNCDTSRIETACAPQFITCCGPFLEGDRFREVFPDAVDARLLALYFSLQRTQWCSPVNLPSVDYTLPYDSIIRYFHHFTLAGGYHVTVRPDSLISFTIDSAATCNATAYHFISEPIFQHDASKYIVCRKPLQPTFPRDDNGCIQQQVNVALGNAHSDYLEYMEKIKRDYRQAYYSKCLSITPRLSIEATYNDPVEYHYTLFYYDQAGNLVKTIPPAGVRPVDEEQNGQVKMDRIKNSRLADKAYCYEYGDAPSMNGNASITVADNPLIQQHTSAFAIEAFVNFNSLSGRQVIISKQSSNPTDNYIDGYKIYLDNGKLSVDLMGHGNEQWLQTLSKLVPYNRPPPFNNLPPVNIRAKVEVPVQRNVYRSLTAQVGGNRNDLLTVGKWSHIIVQSTGDRDNPIRIYIDGNVVNSQIVSDKSIYTPATSPALTSTDISAGTTELSFIYQSTNVPIDVSNSNVANLIIGASANGLIGKIKQLRIYNRLLPATEIRNNAYNTCLVPQSEGSLVLWLPLNREETAGTSLDRINQFTTSNAGTVFSMAYQPVYPVHQMPTHYYFNSLNAISRQVSPDAGETNLFYDLAGRLVVSQNAEQKNSTRGEANGRYSYTKYDVLGRIVETGEKSGATSMTTAIAKTDPAVVNSAINNWLSTGTNTQITQTIYDQPNTTIVTNSEITSNQVLYTTSRKRVVATVYRAAVTSQADYNNATHYQYDINGNIKRLWQEQKKSVTGVATNLLKDLQYGYDLVSGKVNQIIYQKGKGDQFVYRYEYDPDNRLLHAFSGRDINTLQQDAGYRYYLHGPLARMELGDALTNRIVQGVDYIYTLQGWLKGINGAQRSANPSTIASTDAGEDGSILSANGKHAQVAADAMSFSLGYHQDDYIPIGGSMAAAFTTSYQYAVAGTNSTNGSALFNGNISSATYSIAGIDHGNTRGYSYHYDQLNRLLDMRSHNLSGIVQGQGWNNSSATDDHKESFSYDPNGNIASLTRNGTAGAGRKLQMDDQNYQYNYYTPANIRKTYTPGQPLPADVWALTNQLSYIKDAVPAGNYPAPAFPDEKDIDNQADANYSYDRIGNLVKDNAEGITGIGWTAYGKIRGITKTGGTEIIYDYDAAGNRIQKQVVGGGSKTITSYIRDVQGNVIAVYEWKGAAATTPVIAAAGNGFTGQVWAEQHLHGSGRIGIWKPGITVPPTLNTTTDVVRVGTKFFELNNHLGNVLAVISDRKVAVPLTSNPALTDYYVPDLISANDYTAFGMPMAGRSYRVPNTVYRYGFNSKENDNDVKGEGNQQDYGMRVYDGRVGRFLSSDPITSKYPALSPYQFSSDNPIAGIDQDGLEYSPAGKIGIFAVDNTALQLCYDNPNVILQQKADAPLVHLRNEFARLNLQPTYLTKQWVPANEWEKERYEINKRQWRDRDGYNDDGTPKPLTRLANNKTWNAFANNLALPTLDAMSYLGGEKEAAILLEVAAKNTSRETIAAFVDDVLLSSTSAIKKLDKDAIVGYRGSLATGIKYKTGMPFDPGKFDVDAFIVSDKLAEIFKKKVFFRDGRKISDLKPLSNEIENIFKQIPGYGKGDKFTFRIFTSKEFKSKIKPGGYKRI